MMASAVAMASFSHAHRPSHGSPSKAEQKLDANGNPVVQSGFRFVLHPNRPNALADRMLVSAKRKVSCGYLPIGNAVNVVPALTAGSQLCLREMVHPTACRSSPVIPSLRGSGLS